MDLKDLTEYINYLKFDLTAEFLGSCLFESELNVNDVIFSPDGQLKRQWSYDIQYSEVMRFENEEETIILHLNRDGFYDSLPETLFHETIDNYSFTGIEMAKESMKLKAEEKEIRSFFLPFENEIINYRVKLTTKENNIFTRLYSDFIQAIISGFWKIDAKIPNPFKQRLFNLIPFANKIITDFALITQSLEYILNEEVTMNFEKSYNNNQNCVETNNVGILGASRLGNDTVCGNHVNGFINKVIFNIGPIKNIEIREFLPERSVGRLLKCFCSYFVPMELDSETNIISNADENPFILSDHKLDSRGLLGYNTLLN